MSEYIDNLKHSFAPHIDNANALGNRWGAIQLEAIQTIKDILNKLPHKEFRLVDYHPDYSLVFTDATRRNITSVFLYNDELFLQDEDRFDYMESDGDWPDPLDVLTDLTEALSRKIDDLKRLKVGARVKWIDPAIDDYDPDDREEQLQLIWVIDDCPTQDELDSDSTISISNEYGEAEVLPWELVYVDDGV
jgi:hypothetical protein